MAALRAKKKVKKESLSSIRTLVQQEIKNFSNGWKTSI
jgi:hypothetical protein